MAAEKSLPRPRQATLAGWVVVIGSVLLVVSAYERIAGLGSLETQDAIREFLDDSPGGVSLGLEDARAALRVLALVAGAAGAATAVLGGYALTGSRSARLALSILALPVFVGGLGVGGFMSAFVVVGIGALWLQPTRSWFAGVAPPEPPAARRPTPPGRLEPPREAAREQQPAGVTAPSGPPPSGPPPSGPPPSGMTPSGTTPAWPSAPGSAPPSGPGPYQGYGVPRPGHQPAPPSRRPSSVTAACLTTWITTGLVAVLVGLTGLVMLATPDLLFDELRRQDADVLGQISESEARTATLVVCALTLLWCLGSVLAAVAVFRGRAWGRTALLVSCGLVGALSLVLLVGSLALVVPLAASAATLGLLLRPESRAWCRPAGR